METASVSIDGWIDKEEVIYTHTMEYYEPYKRRAYSMCNNMARPADSTLSKRQIPYDLTSVWNVKKKNKQNKIHRRQKGGHQQEKGWVGAAKWVKEIKTSIFQLQNK